MEISARSIKLRRRSTDFPRRSNKFPDEGRPISHEGRPISHEGRPISHEGRPNSNEGRPISHEGRPISHEGRPISHEGRPISHEGRPISEIAGTIPEHDRTFAGLASPASRIMRIFRDVGVRERTRTLRRSRERSVSLKQRIVPRAEEAEQVFGVIGTVRVGGIGPLEQLRRDVPVGPADVGSLVWRKCRLGLVVPY